MVCPDFREHLLSYRTFGIEINLNNRPFLSLVAFCDNAFITQPHAFDLKRVPESDRETFLTNPPQNSTTPLVRDFTSYSTATTSSL
jgi:hypothetical protein